MLRQFLADEKNGKAKLLQLLDAKENELKSANKALSQCRTELVAMKKQLEQATSSRSKLLYILLLSCILIASLVFGRN
uniref:Uncharacterized protein n=1 Tax=Oryza punctata TaxID=4537 RepID=A0A0E0JPC4_ORYPU